MLSGPLANNFTVPLDWGSVFYIPGPLTVTQGATLTLQPGTIVKSQYPYCGGLTVNGTLQAQGTTPAPIVFTSGRDDTVGGDTNGDGSASSPAPGDWAGLSVNPTGSLALHHVLVRYGGFTPSPPPHRSPP